MHLFPQLTPDSIWGLRIDEFAVLAAAADARAADREEVT